MQAKSPVSDDLETLIQRAEELLSSKPLAHAEEEPLAKPTAEIAGIPDLVHPTNEGANRVETKDADNLDPVDKLRAAVIARVQTEERHRLRVWLSRRPHLLAWVFLLGLLVAGTALWYHSMQAKVSAAPIGSNPPEVTAPIPPMPMGSDARKKEAAPPVAGSVRSQPHSTGRQP